MASLDELERQCPKCRWWFKENYWGHIADCAGWYGNRNIWMRTHKRYGWNIPEPPYEEHQPFTWNGFGAAQRAAVATKSG